jgi:hypothetical protein
MRERMCEVAKMAVIRCECELIGLVQYSSELTYEALYDIEERFIQRMQASLESLEAERLDFWGTGDALQFQCGLPSYDPDSLRSLCDEAAACLDEGANGKIVCIDKHLTRIGVFRVAPQTWSEEVLDIADANDSDVDHPRAPRQGDSSPSEY